jgi:hypothetical protein
MRTKAFIYVSHRIGGRIKIFKKKGVITNVYVGMIENAKDTHLKLTATGSVYTHMHAIYVRIQLDFEELVEER